MGRSSLVDRMVSIYRTVLALSSVHVRYDEASGERYKVISINAKIKPSLFGEGFIFISYYLPDKTVRMTF